MPAGEKHLSVAVATALPFTLARLGLNARQYAFVQSVDVPVLKNRAIELVLHRIILPDLARAKTSARARHLDHRRSLAVARRDEEAILIQHDWLSDIDARAVLPRRLPEQSAVFDSDADDAACRHNQSLPLARERDQHRRSVRSLIVEGFPDGRAAQPVIGDDGFPRRPARQYDHLIVNDERRCSHSPVYILRAVLAQDVTIPDELSGLCIQTAKLARGPE